MSDAGGNGRPEAPPQEAGGQAFGADEARAYVPPQPIKQKAKPVDDGGAKVQIREGVDPRRAKTVQRQAYEGGTLPMQPVPPEVRAHAAARAQGTPASPQLAGSQHGVPQHTPPQGVAAAGPEALPFRAAEPSGQLGAPPAVPPPVMAGQAAPPAVVPPMVQPAQAAPMTSPVAHIPVGPRPKRPPQQLVSPGVLSGPQGAPASVQMALGLAAAHVQSSPAPAHAVPAHGGPAHAVPAHGGPAHGAPAHAVPPHVVPAHAVPPHAAPAHAVPPHAAPAHAVPAHAVPPHAAPAHGVPAQAAAPAGYPPPPIPVGHSSGSGADGAVSAPAPSAQAQASIGEHPLAATNSPWSQEQKLSADVLPSASVLAPPDAEPAPAPPPVAPEVEPHSRTAMTIGLAVAAVALIAAVVYFTVSESDKSDDPANVKVGSEQREYGDEPLPAPTASEEPKVAPKPPPPLVLPKAPPKPKPKEDIYENIE